MQAPFLGPRIRAVLETREKKATEHVANVAFLGPRIRAVLETAEEFAAELTAAIQFLGPRIRAVLETWKVLHCLAYGKRVSRPSYSGCVGNSRPLRQRQALGSF